MEDPIQPFIDSFGLIKDSEGKPSGPLGQPLSVDRIHLGINLSVKLLWCTYILYSRHQHIDAKEKIK